MNVAQLIKILQKHPPRLPVAYKCFSEQCLLEKDDIVVEEHCKPRNDGWVQNKRPDMESQKYLVFPGN